MNVLATTKQIRLKFAWLFSCRLYAFALSIILYGNGTRAKVTTGFL